MKFMTPCVTAVLALSVSAYAGTYQLRVDDTLQVSLTGLETLSGKYKVSMEGNIELPGLGTIKCLGRTTADVAEGLKVLIVKEGLKDVAKKHDVVVVVSDYAPSTVYIRGKIRRPQAINSSPTRPLTLTQAIAVAGDFAAGADASAVQVHRTDPATGKTDLKVVDVTAITGKGELHLDLPLADGDRIFVPEREPCYIFGAVKKPGDYTLPVTGTLTLSKLIVKAGGWARYASRSNVIVLRRSPDGKKSIKFRVNVGRIIKEGELSKDLVLKPGDIIFVDETWI